MYTRAQRLSLKAISLAILLAIIDQTQGFTLRYEYVRPSDLIAEESRVQEVRHELKRDVVENEEFQVAPIAVALPLTMSTESIAESTITTYVTMTSSNIKNDTSDQTETTINPNEQGEISKVSSVEDFTNTTVDNVEVETLLVRDLKDVDTTVLPQEETTTVITTTFITTTAVADMYIEASAKEEKNHSKDISNISSIVNTTTSNITVTKTPNIKAKTINNTAIATESNVNSSIDTITRKKYTKIERKPVNISNEVTPLRIERVGDSLNAHSTTESRVSLEKVFNLVPDIQSLQELKNHLLEATNSVPTEVNPTEIVSKRAGYLNHTTNTKEAPISTSVNASGAGNEIEIDGVGYEVELHDENDYTHNKTSHSQMVEDALKEEFLAEAHLEDKTLFTTTPKNNRANVELNEITISPQHNIITPSDQQQVEDNLTVRPINNDKKSILYTVSPNYRPLKKIEVQAMKPFVRDPDDNSWRNQSLSSLGIVFKGTNSTKAFTEVLKNKTETVMSNITDPEKVLTKVDLRDRLEKIAEKRKRKKKIDKFGNPEYSDYEENSSGDMHTSKEKPEISLTTPSIPIGLINPGISLGTILNASPGEDSSRKSKKNKHKFTPSDYYDGKDDDIDYATYPNIDILKSTPRPRVQWPVTQKILDNTQPIRPYLPDRQPTVQYFPPRPKTGNGNDYRDDFKHKFTVFGHTTQPENEPIETYTKKAIPSKYVTADRGHISDENKNLAIQHVEYRPVGERDEGYVIRHYKDLLEAVAKEADYDRNGPYPTSTISDEGKAVKSEEYDYGQRKETLNKFVDYFNQNHERFKADFPVIFNTTVVHGAESGKVLASSSAMFKRLYNGARGQSHTREAFGFSNKPFDPDCENVTVELSPAYELHYYVPEQEEIGADHTIPYGYRTNL